MSQQQGFASQLMNLLKSHGVEDDKNDTSDKTNDETNVDNFDSLWEDTDETNADDTTKSDTQTEPSKKDSEQDPFESHVNSQRFLPQITEEDLEELREEIQAGKLNKLSEIINSVGRNAYRQSLITSNSIVSKKIEDAIETAVRKATASSQSTAALDQLHGQLKFTKDPDIKPISEAVFARLMKKNKNDIQKSVDGTQKFFRALSSKKNLPRDVPGDKGFGNSRSGGNYISDDDDNDTDWDSLLGGTP